MHATPPHRPAARDPHRGRASGLGFLIALVFALPGTYLWLAGSGPVATTAGACWTSAWLAVMVFHHRTARGLTRFHPIPPPRAQDARARGAGERGLDGVGFMYMWLCIAAVGAFPFLESAYQPIVWTSIPIVIVLVAAARLLWIQGPQARTLWRMWRAGAHRAGGTWGTTAGTLARGGVFTRRIDVIEWTVTREGSETVQTASGGTAEVKSTSSSSYTAGRRVEQRPDAIELATGHGPLIVRGCQSAAWGTSRPLTRRLPRRDSDDPAVCIEEHIAPGDSVLVYGRLQLDPATGQRWIEAAGPGSLLLFAAPAGQDARAALRGRLFGHTLGVLLLLAALAPALSNALSRPM